ncbi:DnaB-like helicase C-terminal domain-containing protein [Yersinia ruckeri]|uniref:DnaB-like helicase C-terminal domain-containing protein n=1 Tax=Yersinia ruckeri TaxID=29486 RepID=UPI002236FC62|nr:DnaB-like helicase C-terminal domain-containing protein [Yersinia ruckeri]MCW6598784.1 AAA family ATPase [Yersinia ruckeri]
MSTTPNPSEFDQQLQSELSNISTSERMDLEIKILASYLRGPSQVQKQILSKLQPAAYVYTGNVWRRITLFVQEGIMNPDLSVVLQDNEIGQVERGMAESSYHEIPVETIEEADLLLRRIHEQYYRDELVQSISTIGAKLTSGNDYDSSRAREELSKKLEQLAATMDEGGMVGVGLGYDSNSVFELLTETQSAQIIPTGIEGFDRVGGGIAKGELHINACPSSGGKTTLMNQLCLNMGLGMQNREYVRQPLSVFYISLEMSQREMWGRMIANLSGIPVARFRQAELMSDEEKQQVAETLKSMSEYLAANGHMFRFENAEYGSIDAITRVLATHPFDIVIVDYLNLMADGENLWSSMGSIARSLKLLAQKRNFACITAAQLDEDSLKIRYSRMVKEHCDTIWLWTPSGGVKDANDEVVSAFTEIYVDKGRNIGKFSFWVHFDFAHMIVNSVNPITELGLNGAAPANQVQRLPGVSNPSPLGLPDTSTIGAGNNMATQLLNQSIEHNILTPPALNQVDAAAGFTNMPGSIPKQIREGANAFESDTETAVYGEDAEEGLIKPTAKQMGAVPLTPPGAMSPPNPMAQMSAPPAFNSTPNVEPPKEETPWVDETPTQPDQPVSVKADEVETLPDDNKIEI